MKNFDGGVGYYTTGYAAIHFPEDDVCCNWCPLMGMELKSDRRYCRASGEYLPAYNTAVGLNCPIKFEEVNDGQLRAL